MGRSDKMDKCIEARGRERRRVERIAETGIGVSMELMFRSLAAERTNKVAPFAEAWDERGPNVPSASRYVNCTAHVY